MSDDLLAPYRRPGSKPAGRHRSAASEPAGSVLITPPPVRYQAFNIVPDGLQLFRFEMRSNDGYRIVRPYAAAGEFIYAADYEALWIQFPQGRLAVMGLHLKPVIEAILAQRCEWIAELGKDEKAPPVGEPVILRMLAKAKTLDPSEGAA